MTNSVTWIAIFLGVWLGMTAYGATKFLLKFAVGFSRNCSKTYRQYAEERKRENDIGRIIGFKLESERG